MRLAQAVFIIAVLGVVAYSLSFLGLLGSAPGTSIPATSEPDLVFGLGVRDVMMVVISVIVLGCSLFVILSKRYDDATQKWAFGAVGTLVGFWLKTT